MNNYYYINKLVSSLIRVGHKQRFENKIFDVLKVLKLEKKRPINWVLSKSIQKVSVPFEMVRVRNKKLKAVSRYPTHVIFKRRVHMSIKTFSNVISTLQKSSKRFRKLYLLTIKDRVHKEISDICNERGFSVHNKNSIYKYVRKMRALFPRYILRKYSKKRRRKVKKT